MTSVNALFLSSTVKINFVLLALFENCGVSYNSCIWNGINKLYTVKRVLILYVYVPVYREIVLLH